MNRAGAKRLCAAVLLSFAASIAPVAKEIPEEPANAAAPFAEAERGSIIVVVATDAPLFRAVLKKYNRLAE